jgi:hypothetical protein
MVASARAAIRDGGKIRARQRALDSAVAARARRAVAPSWRKVPDPDGLAA